MKKLILTLCLLSVPGFAFAFLPCDQNCYQTGGTCFSYPGQASYCYYGPNGPTPVATPTPTPIVTPVPWTSPTPTPTPTPTPAAVEPMTIIDIPLILNDGKSRWYRFIILQ